MEKSNKRGKIPQADWPLIMARYEAGETLASIARTYDCSPPAISYVVSRSRARQPDKAPASAAPSAVEAHLIKAETPPAAHRPAPAVAATDGLIGMAEVAGADGDRQAPLPLLREASPPPRPVPAAVNGDHRRTLHLSLGNGAQSEGTRGDIRHSPGSDPDTAAPGPERQSAGRDRDDRNGGRNGNLYHGQRDGMPRKEAGGAIDQELRARVDADISAFLAAFDAALAEDNEENRSALRETTDRLLRAGARTRIELERLEARVPLPRRNNGAPAEPAWRYR